MQLCFDFDRIAVTPVIALDPAALTRGATSQQGDNSARRARGRKGYHPGLLAEASVADHYRAAGYVVLHNRWRGKAGEIDMILRKGDCFIFVEVKASSSFSRAAERLNRRQMDRICMAACEFCGSLPTGQMTEMRMDAALVDQYGRVEVIENAFGGH